MPATGQSDDAEDCMHGDDVAKHPRRGVWAIIRSYVRMRPGICVLYGVALLTATLVNVVGLTKLTASMIQHVSAGNRPAALRLFGMIAGTMFGLIGINYVVDRTEAEMMTSFEAHVQSVLATRVMRSNEAAFKNRNPIEYRNAMATATIASARVFQSLVQSYLPNTTLSLTLIAYLATLDARFFVVFGAACGAVASLFALTGPQLRAASRCVNARNERVRVDVFDVFKSLDVVVTSNSTERELDTINRALRNAAKHEEAYLVSVNNFSYAIYAIIAVAIVTTELISISSMGTAGVSTTSILLAVTLMHTARGKTAHVASTNVTMLKEQGKYNSSELPELADDNSAATLLPPDNVQDAATSRRLAAASRVDVNNFAFQYPDNNDEGDASEASAPTRTLSFSFGPRGIHCLRGPSGYGKSTLARVLAGLYREYTGSIKIDGVEVSTMSHADHRAAVALSQQSASVLNRTIGETIVYGTRLARDGSPQEVTDAIDRVWRTVSGSFGDMTPASSVGIDGANLSTGQLQILRLASVQLSDAGIVVLDEPCNGLDNALKAVAHALIRNLGQSRTVLLITHDGDTASVAASETRVG